MLNENSALRLPRTISLVHSGETASVGALRSAPTLYPAIRDNNIVNNMVVCPIYTEYYSVPSLLKREIKEQERKR